MSHRCGRIITPFLVWLSFSLVESFQLRPRLLPPTTTTTHPISSHILKYQFHKKTFARSSTTHTYSTTSSLLSTSTASSIQEPTTSPINPTGTLFFLLPSVETTPSKFGSKSPVPNPSYTAAAEQLVRKLHNFSEGRISSQIITPSQLDYKPNDQLLKSDALIALGLSTIDDLEFLSQVFDHRTSNSNGRQCHLALDCAVPLHSKTTVGPYDSSLSLKSLLPWTSTASGKRMSQQLQELFHRWTSDDAVIGILLYFHQFTPCHIPWVEHSIDATWEKGPIQNIREITSMVRTCGDCIGKCLADENCRQCISALNEVDTRDQVASYRTVVSFESELLKEFSFCILQKHNVFGCSADVPTLPEVEPMKVWRGESVTQEVARGILIGHLDDEEAPEGSLKLDVSWKVACGANVAYDQFPSQHQLFYPNSKGKDMWYDPVFRVETIDGRDVWCKRHYKVRSNKVPGTFQFSVLDNGVTSNEFWTIVGAADDLSWVILHYAGAASAVGQRYIGGLLCTPDGSLPPVEQREEIWKVLRSAGIEPWELFVVDNDMQSSGALAVGPPPLDYFRKDVLKAKAEKLSE